MTIKATSRRQLVKSAVAAPIMGAPVLAPATPADAELRRLLREYVDRMRVYHETEAPYLAAAEAVKAETPSPRDVPWEVYRREWERASEKHSRGQLYDRWCEADRAVRETIKAIRATPAEGVFGIGVKLAALGGWTCPENLEEAVYSVMDDVARLTGGELANDKERPVLID
jgi:hypothetical protein